jgi:triacylglycerol lipase
MSRFNPIASGYSAQNAIGLAAAAQLAYQGPDTIRKTALAWGFPTVHCFDTGSTQAYLMGNDDLIVLAFRGTEMRCLRDWMTDARILLVDGVRNGKVHRGFMIATNVIGMELMAKLMTCRTRNQPVLLTGHSLGAALATLTAAKLREQNYAIDGLYTFGSPRVGDKKFAAWFNQDFGTKAFRFVNNNDVVTRVVPRALGYDHVGNCLYFDEKGRLQRDRRFWDQFLERLQGGIDDFLKPNMTHFADHDMGLYTKRLEQNANTPVSV